MRVDTPILNADGSVCCGDGAHRRYVCQYHEGWLDGREAALGEQVPRFNGPPWGYVPPSDSGEPT